MSNEQESREFFVKKMKEVLAMGIPVESIHITMKKEQFCQYTGLSEQAKFDDVVAECRKLSDLVIREETTSQNEKVLWGIKPFSSWDVIEGSETKAITVRISLNPEIRKLL